MAQTADNNTRTLRQNDPRGWIALLEVFTLLTDLIGEPNEALHEIWRAVLSGKVSSLRRRLLSDEGMHDVVLDRATWRSIRLFAAKYHGRQTVGMRVVDEADPSIVGPRCIFYLRLADAYATWPQLLQSEPENFLPGPAKASRRKGSYRGATQRTRARVVLRRIYKDGNYPTEEEVSTPDLWILFCKEYDRGKEKRPSKLGRPSIETVLREVGRK